MNDHVSKALEASAQSILIAFGERPQLVKTCEELAELTVQLCKHLNGSPTTQEAIIDEIADALIMIYQMRAQFGQDEVDARILVKLNRTLTYIRNRKTQ